MTSGGVGTTTIYVGDLEDIATTGSTTTLTTTSYYAGSKRIAQAVNDVFSYLGADGLGSALVALSSSGNAQASVLYGPYGAVRYNNGAMPGSYGYTGQHSDGATGLDDYSARYYDPVASQFASADTLLSGLSRYGYVGGNSTSFTDPSGHVECESGCEGGGPREYGPMPDVTNFITINFTERGGGGSMLSGVNPSVAVSAVNGVLGIGTVSDLAALYNLSDDMVAIPNSDGSVSFVRASDLYGEQWGTVDDGNLQVYRASHPDDAAVDATTPPTTDDGGPGKTPPGAGGPSSGTVTTEDLHAFGGSPDGPNPGPRGARSGTDLVVDGNDMITESDLPKPGRGASTTLDPIDPV